MADLQKLVHGEPSWDAKVNKIIDYLESKIGDNDLKWVDKGVEGIVFQNGFKNQGTHYRYAQIGNAKLVDLQLSVTLPDGTNPSAKGLTAATIPDDIVPQNFYKEYMESNKYQVALHGNQFIIGLIGDAQWWGGNGSHYLYHATYTHID